jgi:hypothetical protein
LVSIRKCATAHVAKTLPDDAWVKLLIHPKARLRICAAVYTLEVNTSEYTSTQLLTSLHTQVCTGTHQNLRLRSSSHASMHKCVPAHIGICFYAALTSLHTHVCTGTYRNHTALSLPPPAAAAAAAEVFFCKDGEYGLGFRAQGSSGFWFIGV